MVMKKCGAPLLKEVVGEKIFGDYGSWNQIIIEQWIYDMGDSKFFRVLTFQGTKLAHIDLDERL